MKHKLQVH